MSFTAAELKELRLYVDNLDEAMHQTQSTGSQSLFYKQVIEFIVKKLDSFSKQVKKMQMEKRERTISAYRLLSDSHYNSFIPIPVPRDALIESKVRPQLSKISFSQRFIDEVAPPSKMKEYEAIATQHKQQLLKESRLLETRFGSELREVRLRLIPYSSFFSISQLHYLLMMCCRLSKWSGRWAASRHLSTNSHRCWKDKAK